MSEPVKVNVVSYGGVKPGQVVVGNKASGERTTLFDAATATDGSYMFYGCTGLPAWTVALPSLTDGTSMFYRCTGLTSWTVALPNLTNGSNMFQGCTGLPSWNAALPNLTNGNRMFLGCTGLTSFTADLPKLTNGVGMFNNTRLTSWTVDLPKLTDGSSMFYIVDTLTSFTVDLPKLTDGNQMFQGCNLNASSVLQILTSIPDRAAAGLAAAKLHIGRNTNYKNDADVAAMLGTVAPVAAGTYSFKGWTITVQS